MFYRLTTPAFQEVSSHPQLSEHNSESNLILSESERNWGIASILARCDCTLLRPGRNYQREDHDNEGNIRLRLLQRRLWQDLS